MGEVGKTKQKGMELGKVVNKSIEYMVNSVRNNNLLFTEFKQAMDLCETMKNKLDLEEGKVLFDEIIHEVANTRLGDDIKRNKKVNESTESSRGNLKSGQRGGKEIVKKLQKEKKKITFMEQYIFNKKI